MAAQLAVWPETLYYFHRFSLISPVANFLVISVGADNRFGHPDEITLRKLEDFPTYRTDHHGNVQLITDGERYWVVTER